MVDGLFRRRRLPHWDVDDGTYFVTTCLEGSIPAQGFLELYRYRGELESRPKPDHLSDEEWETCIHKLLFARFDSIIDMKPAVIHFSDPALAAIVRDALYHFAEDRYHLLAYVIMPSHVHWVFQPRRPWIESLRDYPGKRTPRERIIKSINGYTAYRCNQLLGRRGPFWQRESYDHVVRDDQELLRIIEYVEQNPVRAALVGAAAAWRWSSAADRPLRAIIAGQLALR